MIKAIIVDDEPHCIDALVYDITRYCPGIKILTVCSSAKAGIAAITEHEPDLVFLDIEMPGMNGFEMLLQIEECKFDFIFTTAYSEFVLNALRAGAVDYLLKPIDSSELINAVEKVSKKSNAINTKMESVLKMSDMMTMSLERMLLTTRDGYEFIVPANVTHCTADGAYTNIYYTDGKKSLVSKSLGNIEKMLPPKIFARIHHSNLVNINYISKVKRGTDYTVVMANGDKLNVARSKKELLLQIMNIRV